MPGIGWARASSSGQSVQFFRFLCPPNYPTGLRGGLVNIRDPAGNYMLRLSWKGHLDLSRHITMRHLGGGFFLIM